MRMAFACASALHAANGRTIPHSPSTFFTSVAASGPGEFHAQPQQLIQLLIWPKCWCLQPLLSAARDRKRSVVDISRPYIFGTALQDPRKQKNADVVRSGVDFTSGDSIQLIRDHVCFQRHSYSIYIK